MLFTRSAQLWQYLLYLKTLQRLEFGDACWVQTGRFQIWPAPTSQEYKSTKLSLIVMIFIWKLFQILLNFRKINLFFKIYLCNINISVKMSQRGNIAGSFYQYLLILGFHTAMEYSYKKSIFIPSKLFEIAISYIKKLYTQVQCSANTAGNMSESNSLLLDIQ